MVSRQLYDKTAQKRPVNLTLNSDLVAKAREAGLNLSALAEGRIVQELERLRDQEWKQLLTDEAAAHDAYLIEYGCMADLLREETEDRADDAD